MRSLRTGVLAASFLLSLTGLLRVAAAQRAYTTEDAYPTRYFAAHGTRALLGGNSAAGIEAYVYPLQLFRGLQVSFRVGGSPAAVAGRDVLRRIIYAPTYIERIYENDRFTVTEHLAIAVSQPAGEISYSIRSHEPVAIELSFVPVLDLMWPAGIGGEEVHWRPDLNAYLLDEPTHRFAGIVGSPDIALHDTPNNTNAPLDSETRLHMQLKPAERVTVFFAASSTGVTDAQSAYQLVSKAATLLDGEAATREEERQQSALHIVTPSDEVNQALAWSELALDQAWSCNPALGCGLIGGYGPSRGISRRPQYAWFFAGDGMDSLRALLESGDFSRAREELLFLLRYQDKDNGMMWHELSQSAAYLNWKRDYPYLFVHVDITPAFLHGVAEYVRITGDTGFARDHWEDLAISYRYMSSLLDPADGLPRVPAGKAGHDEQSHPPQELGFTIDCLEASKDYAFLADSTGHREQAEAARRTAVKISGAVVARLWNSQAKFFNSGVMEDGQPTRSMRLPAEGALQLLSSTQRADVLDRVAGQQFQTAWGARSVAADSATFDPASYATGSVWARSTSAAATMLWQNGRSAEAWQTWQKLIPWATLDSMGHIHETVSGESFRPQTESVPEQTWSSALMLSSFVDGVLGIRYDAPGGRLFLTPQLPAEWGNLSVEHLRVGLARIDLKITRTEHGLEVNARATEGSVHLSVTLPQRTGTMASQLVINDTPCRGASNSSCDRTIDSQH